MYVHYVQETKIAVIIINRDSINVKYKKRNFQWEKLRNIIPSFHFPGEKVHSWDHHDFK